MESAFEADHGRPSRVAARELDGVLDGLGARVEERGLRRARERRERGQPLGVLDVDLVGDDREVGVEEARGLLLHRRDDAGVGVADVEAADAAREVDEAVAVDVGDGRAAPVGDHDRQVEAERIGDDPLLPLGDLAGARPRDLGAKLDRPRDGHTATISGGHATGSGTRVLESPGMVLSDATIARLLAEGRIEIDPYDEALLQPSSVDVRVDRLFRVFHNNRYPFIDVKVEQAELTELVEVEEEQPFVLHPGEFVLGSTLERIRLPDDLVARLEGKSSARPARPSHPLDRGLHRPGLGRPRDARALERRQPADHDLPGHEDRADLLHADDGAGHDAVRRRRDRLEVQGPARADGEPLLAELRGAVTVLVTGGTGFIGPHVVHALRARETPVRALVRKPARATRLAAWGVELAAGDVTDPASLRAACEGVTTVVHLVAIIRGRPADFERVMAEGTRNVVDGRAGGGRAAVRARERARPRRAIEGRGPVLRREVGDGAGRPRVGTRPRDLPAELRLRPRRGRPADLRPSGALRAGDADHRAGTAAAAADLDRGSCRVLRARGHRAGGDEPDVRARRPRGGELERVLGAPEARARGAAAVGARPFRR